MYYYVYSVFSFIVMTFVIRSKYEVVNSVTETGRSIQEVNRATKQNQTDTTIQHYRTSAIEVGSM